MTQLHPLIRQAVNNVLCAYNDAKDDPSSCVASDLHIMRAAVLGLETHKGGLAFLRHVKLFDDAFNNLMRIGYGYPITVNEGRKGE